MRKTLLALSGLITLLGSAQALATPSIDYPIVKLRSLDKTSARASTFEAAVGSTVKFGDIFIKVQACRKAPEMETPESAAFLQIWEVSPADKAEWIFSGWMFASSPGLSAMDHPIYDVWVLDCLEKKGTGEPIPEEEKPAEGEGELNKGEEPAQPAIESEVLQPD